jgi:hypothetical protein
MLIVLHAWRWSRKIVDTCSIAKNANKNECWHNSVVCVPKRYCVDWPLIYPCRISSMPIRKFWQCTLKHIVMWLDTGFGLVTRFNGLLQTVTRINIVLWRIHALYSSLQHAQSLLRLLCLHKSLLDNGSNTLDSSASVFMSLPATDFLMAPHGCSQGRTGPLKRPRRFDQTGPQLTFM